jgi:pimeloyl-ACP methyl ester carboxylesterase
MNVGNEGPKKSFRITLVHGTWPYGLFARSRKNPTHKTRWFEENSNFRSELSSRLERIGGTYILQSFKWSGENSIQARERAAEALGAILSENIGENDVDVIIGHSHGGTVALRCLNYIGDRDRPVLIASIATPFLSFGVVPFSISNKKVNEIAIAFSYLTFVMTLIYGWFFASLRLFESYLRNQLFWLSVAAFVGIITNFALRGVSALADSSKSDDYERFSVRIPRRRFDCHVLSLRGYDDEANFVLTIGALGARLCELAVRIIYEVSMGAAAIISSWTWVLAFWVAVILSIWIAGEELAGTFIQNAFYLFASLMFAAIITYVLVVVVGNVCRGVYGREMIFSSIRLMAVASSAPDTNVFNESRYDCGVIELETVTIQPIADQGLRHCLYENLDCTNEIVRWLERAVQKV